MKNIIKVMILAGGLILFANTNSYALFDVSAYGGLTFSGEVDPDTDFKAIQYGLKAHYNNSILPLLELGLGAYYQQSKIKYADSYSFDADATKQSLGLDVNLIVSLPVIHPYGRFTYSIWDKCEDTTENFKAWGAGLGLELTIIPFFRVFAEYMYDSADYDAKMTSSSANLGIKFDF